MNARSDVSCLLYIWQGIAFVGYGEDVPEDEAEDHPLLKYKGDDVLATRVPPRTPGHLRRKIVKIKQGLKRGRCSSIQLRLHVEHLECGR